MLPSIRARRFCPEDYSQIKEWCKERDVKTLPLHGLADIGFIVDGKAVCFLYTTNSSIAICEGLMTNPNTTKEERLEAMTNVLTCIYNEANRLGFKIFKCDTKFDSVKKLAMSFGFKDCGRTTNLMRSA